MPVTPRKRKSTVDIQTPRSTKGKSKGYVVCTTLARPRVELLSPAPNPPLAPFPTPPSSRHHRDKISQPVFAPAHSLTPPSTPSKHFSSAAPLAASQQLPTTSCLPPHLQTLLTLHHAFNLALALHIATHPPVLPPHPPSSTKLDLPNLTNYLSIKETVERTSGRRFGLPELGRLAWIWDWDGEQLPDEKSQREKRKQDSDEDNPFLVPSDHATTSRIQISGLSYLITPTRTLEPHSGRRVYTHGIGIELELKPGETRQVLHGGNEGVLGNKGQGGGAGAIGRWNTASEGRQSVFRGRLERWVELNGGYEVRRGVHDTRYWLE